MLSTSTQLWKAHKANKQKKNTQSRYGRCKNECRTSIKYMDFGSWTRMILNQTTYTCERSFAWREVVVWVILLDYFKRMGQDNNRSRSAKDMPITTVVKGLTTGCNPSWRLKMKVNYPTLLQICHWKLVSLTHTKAAEEHTREDGCSVQSSGSGIQYLLSTGEMKHCACWTCLGI